MNTKKPDQDMHSSSSSLFSINRNCAAVERNPQMILRELNGGFFYSISILNLQLVCISMCEETERKKHCLKFSQKRIEKQKVRVFKMIQGRTEA